MKWLISALIVLLPLAFAAPVAAQEASTDEDTNDMSSNVAMLLGQVLIGPTCPVVRLDQPDQCQDRPYAATLSIRSVDGSQEIAQTTTDDQGQFSVELDPDTYLVVPLTPAGSILPRGIPQTVTLALGEPTNIVVRYDSGMR